MGYIETETKAYVPPDPTTGHIALEDKRLIHVAYLNREDAYKPSMKKIPPPDVQPKVPEQWSAVAWSKRTVIGNSNYHMFYHAEGDGLSNPSFILKVSKDFRNEKWVYEDMGPMSLELQNELKKLVVKLFEISDVAALLESATNDYDRLTKNYKEIFPQQTCFMGESRRSMVDFEVFLLMLQMKLEKKICRVL